MTRAIETLAEIAADYDAVVFDQWGVLHNGERAYATAVSCVEQLFAQGITMAVLSNSGKRAAPNADRITGMGFGAAHFQTVMSSGEALWQDIAANRVAVTRLFPIERGPGDAALWADGLDVDICDQVRDADGVLLMGLPDGSTLTEWQDTLDRIHDLGLPVYCTNPDRASPRGDSFVVSPGVLAFAYQDMGGTVQFYGKPHQPIFASLRAVLGSSRILMVGDSLEHDIAGAHGAGWDSLLIQGGLYARDFGEGTPEAVLARLTNAQGVAPPTYRMELLK